MRLLVLSTFLLIFSTTTKAQCPNFGGIWLNTQDQVDAFGAMYPNCTYLTGDLFIGPWYDLQYAITDLSPLQNIQSILGNLYVNGQQLLTNVDGLSNLVYVGGTISVSDNAVLTSLEGLSGLTNYQGSIQIFNNQLLENLNGLENIPFNSLYVAYNSSLQELANFSVTELSGLTIEGNGMLTDLSGFENLAYVNSLQISGNDALTNLSALSGLTGNDVYISIQNNPSLTNLAPLSGITSAYILQVTGNSSLQNLNGLNNISSVSEGLQIGDSPQLSDISALSSLTNCPYIYIYNCPSLASLNGLGGLTSMVDISFEYLPSLTSLAGLSNLNYIDFIYLYETGLTSLSGLSSLNAIGGSVSLYSNPQLSFCSIESMCSLLDADGFVDLYGNATGCNSPQEIKDNCSDSTPPTIVCTNNSTTVDADDGVCTYTVPGTAFDPASWEDNQPGATLSNNYNNSSSLAGAVFPTGATEVVWTVTDQSGNTAMCTIQVVVVGQPCGWSTPPDGVGCTNGSDSEYNPATGVWTLTSTNCFAQGGFNSDNQAFIQNELCGNGSITVYVASVTGAGYAGIALRESAYPGAKKVELTTNRTSLNRRATRTVTDGMAVPQPFPSQGRFWLRITRNGNQFRAYVSANGSTWSLVVNTNISMSNCIMAGMLLSNSQPNSTVSATFAGVQINTNTALAMPDSGIQTTATTNAEDAAFNFFPNPASEEITLSLNQYLDKDVSLTVYNTLGQLVATYPLGVVEQTTRPFNISPFKAGIYYLQVETAESRSAPQRLVVQPR